MSISHLTWRSSSVRTTISGISREKKEDNIREPACGQEIHMDNCKLTKIYIHSIFYKSFLIHHLGP